VAELRLGGRSTNFPLRHDWPFCRDFTKSAKNAHIVRLLQGGRSWSLRPRAEEFRFYFVVLIARPADTHLLGFASRLRVSRVMTPAPIPKTAPFDDDQIDLLNSVVGPASATQRAWLAGFLAGQEASAAVPQPAAPPASSEPLTIVFASESGNSEKLAGDMAKAARKNRLKPTIIDMADLDVAELASAKRLVFIAATWGEGEPPSRSARAYVELMGENAPRLDGVEFGVL